MRCKIKSGLDLTLFTLLTIFSISSLATDIYPPELQRKLLSALAQKGLDYKPRTKHFQKNGRPKYTNRLILEDSPYLIQHAHNPVDWFSWGPDAFAKAKREQKPIFLSIGYSTCHWCHVMEKESFDNKEIAHILNKYFISIKVDRERRPDVDATYMTAVMLMTGHGGWPMSSFLTPGGKTFFGGTYFPPERFKKLLERVYSLWREQRAELMAQAERVDAAVTTINSSTGKAHRIDNTVIQAAVSGILQQYDDLQGGFSQAPKFPNETRLFLLLDSAQRLKNQAVLEAIQGTLDAMSRGGIYDQIGGGFHRYATDAAWLIPHFEKMLYNQAHIARVYLQAYLLTGNHLYQRIATETLDYILRDMTDANGGFYSASDADSEEIEGLFYLWTIEQIEQSLSVDDAKLAIEVYGVINEGPFENSNILHLPTPLDDFATNNDTRLANLLPTLDRLREKLRLSREQRVHPLRDDKIVTAWNAMMITTLAMAGEVLDEPRYRQAALRAAQFIWNASRPSHNQLYRVHLNGSSSVSASQEDYAYLSEALIQLYDVSGDSKWLEQAAEITSEMLVKFWDRGAGGFFMNSEMNDDVPLMSRPKDSHDGAIPSGNSVALRVLARLAKRTTNLIYEQKAVTTLAAFSEKITNNPTEYAYMLTGVSELLNGEPGAHQYAAKGAVSAKVQMIKDNDSHWLTLRISIKPGWHINAHQPLQADLVPTMVTLDSENEIWQFDSVEYPKPILKSLEFQADALALYEGELLLRARMSRQKSAYAVLRIQLRLQACNKQVCLAPETLQLSMPAFIR